MTSTVDNLLVCWNSSRNTGFYSSNSLNPDIYNTSFLLEYFHNVTNATDTLNTESSYFMGTPAATGKLRRS